MKLHLFNPENDLALAAGSANFTPPKSVVAFRTALAALPLWLADAGDNVLAPGVDCRWWDDTCRRHGLEVGLGTEGEPAPWGWSANAVEIFRRAGCPGPFPDVEALRTLSHRRTALKLHRALQGELPYPLPPEPAELTSADMLPRGRNDFFLKAPWSCSGRGVADCSGMNAEAIRLRAEGTIRRQGSVMLEPRLEKRRDFAMLFRSAGGKVTFEGLSLFFNSTATAYGGNIVAPQQELAAELNAPYLDETAAAVARALTQIVGGTYEGALGVDMMLHGPDNLICPTVEVNLRCTMGFVALALGRRFGRGELRVTPSAATFISKGPDGKQTLIALTPGGQSSE